MVTSSSHRSSRFTAAGDVHDLLRCQAPRMKFTQRSRSHVSVRVPNSRQLSNWRLLKVATVHFHALQTACSIDARKSCKMLGSFQIVSMYTPKDAPAVWEDRKHWPPCLICCVRAYCFFYSRTSLSLYIVAVDFLLFHQTL